MRAERQQVIGLLKTARGQMDGILKMVEEDRYCIEILNQLLATQSILKKVSREIIRSHMEGCVREAFASGNTDEKVKELISILEKVDK